MPEDFKFDVFLSHSAKDMPVVRELAARLQRDGVCAWLDEEQIKPAGRIPAKIEEGLERSRVLALCMLVGSQSTLYLVKRSGVADMDTKAATTFACYRRTFLR